MILTDIGEIGIHDGRKTYVLRPSLYSISKIGAPKDIVDTFKYVMADVSQYVNAVRLQQLEMALNVIYSCSDENDNDLCDVIGYFDDVRGKTKFRQKKVPVNNIIHLARCLLKHGVSGALPPLRKKDDEPDYLEEFDAREYVAIAMAHLGLSEREAWNTTMTTLAGALRAKFPQNESKSPGAKAPSEEELNATMAWYEKVEQARAKRIKKG